MTNSSEYDQLDDLDRMILTELSLDGRMSLTALAKKLGISKTPCSVRVGRLVSEGVIVGFRAVLDPIEYARTLENLPSIHARPKGAIILASLDGDYVGCVMYQEMAPKLAEVKRLFVAESGRGHGVGHILLTEMFRYMKNDGYERTQFSSARFLTHARDLYEKVGFEEIPLPQDIPDELAETVYFMEKALNVTQNQSSTLTDNAVWDGIFGKRN